MKSKRRKTDHCLNCDNILEDSYEYCPKCGQENDDRQMSFGRLVRNFLDNYFSLDSRFGRSIKPFFFQPGRLTKEFMNGKRMTYANPIRLYLVVSLLHFFFFSISFNQKTNESDEALFTPDNSTEVTQALDEIKLTNTVEVDSVESGIRWPMTPSEWKTAYRMTKQGAPNYPVKQIEDSIRNQRRPYTNRHINRQIIKLMKSDRHTITAQIIKNIPILMFILMPIFALILKMFFKKKLYINHIVHCLHLHSFAFTVLTLFWIIELVAPGLSTSIDTAFKVLIFVYIVLSFRNTYHLTYLKATLMVFSTSFLYVLVLGFGLTIETIISLLTY